MKAIPFNKLNPGDLVRVVWKDNYRTHASLPGAPMQAESFGRVVEVSKDGLSLFQNRVLNADEIGAIECMDGQLILEANVISVEVLS